MGGHSEGESLFEVAFEHAPVGMALLDLSGRWFRVNPALAQLLGYPADELIGMLPSDICHPDDRAAESDVAAALMAGQPTVTVEQRYRHSSGHIVWVRRSSSLVRDEPGFPQYVVAAYEDIGARRSEDARLTYLALHDALTGLANRALLDDRLAQAVAQRDRDGGAVAVLFCDVDGLKVVNDRFGHPFGDELLVAVAQRLNTQVRAADTVARVGGDEFVVVSNVREPADAQAMAGRLAAAVEGHLTAPDGSLVPLRISVGYAVSSEQPVDGASLLREADASMYAAKRLRGRSARYPQPRASVED